MSLNGLGETEFIAGNNISISGKVIDATAEPLSFDNLPTQNSNNV